MFFQLLANVGNIARGEEFDARSLIANPVTCAEVANSTGTAIERTKFRARPMPHHLIKVNNIFDTQLCDNTVDRIAAGKYSLLLIDWGSSPKHN
jgi:hypothetical protein